jgi:hypothetical protein
MPVIGLASSIQSMSRIVVTSIDLTANLGLIGRHIGMLEVL